MIATLALLAAALLIPHPKEACDIWHCCPQICPQQHPHITPHTFVWNVKHPEPAAAR